MKVFDADDERRLLRNPGEQLADDLERFVASVLADVS